MDTETNICETEDLQLYTLIIDKLRTHLERQRFPASKAQEAQYFATAITRLTEAVALLRMAQY